MDEGIQGNESAGEISAIEQTPGFLIPDSRGQLLRDTNRKEYDRLAGNLEQAHRRAAEAGPEVINGSTEFETVAEAEAAAESLRPAQSNVASLQEQADLFSEAQTEMDRLVELGFDSEEVPHDIPAWKVETLKMHRLNAERDYATLTPLITEQLQGLEQSPDILNALSAFNQIADIDPELKEGVVEQIVDWIHRANKQKNESAV